MQAIRVLPHDSGAAIEDFVLPFPAPGEAPRISALIPMERFWLTRSRAGRSAQAPAPFPHLQVILSGTLSVSSGAAERTLDAGDLVLFDDFTGPGHTEEARGEVWRLLVTVPGWAPPAGAGSLPSVAARHRVGRPLMSWMYDDGGIARTEPFHWPSPVTPVPPPGQWPKSEGGSTTRSVQPDEAFAEGSWHRGPRRQLAVTLTGGGENETGDGTVTQPHAGDLVFVDDTTGQGHISRGKGDRRILFVTVADDALNLPRGG